TNRSVCICSRRKHCRRQSQRGDPTRRRVMTYRSKVRTCLWFEKHGLKAAEFYVSLLPNSEIDAVYPHGNPDDPMVVEFTLHGCPMMILTGGPHYKLSPAASISVLTKDQEETDHLWS